MSSEASFGEEIPKWIEDGNKKIPRNTTQKSPKGSIRRGLREGYSRRTLIVSDENFEKLQSYCYWNQRKSVDVVEDIFEAFFASNHVPTREK